MALGDITIFKQTTSPGGRGSQAIIVAASATTIKAGEPVMMVSGASAVVVNQSTNLLTVPSPYSYSTGLTLLLGIAETNSTNTASAAGSVDFLPVNSDTVYLINANTSASVATQALYDALVGRRVLIDLTTNVYTMLTTDSALNGAIIRPLDVFKYPNKIAFSFRNGVSALM